VWGNHFSRERGATTPKGKRRDLKKNWGSRCPEVDSVFLFGWSYWLLGGSRQKESERKLNLPQQQEEAPKPLYSLRRNDSVENEKFTPNAANWLPQKKRLNSEKNGGPPAKQNTDSTSPLQKGKVCEGDRTRRRFRGERGCVSRCIIKQQGWPFKKPPYSGFQVDSCGEYRAENRAIRERDGTGRVTKGGVTELRIMEFDCAKLPQQESEKVLGPKSERKGRGGEPRNEKLHQRDWVQTVARHTKESQNNPRWTRENAHPRLVQTRCRGGGIRVKKNRKGGGAARSPKPVLLNLSRPKGTAIITARSILRACPKKP